MKYHDYFGHETDLLIAEIGHYESEQFTKDIFSVYTERGHTSQSDIY